MSSTAANLEAPAPYIQELCTAVRTVKAPDVALSDPINPRSPADSLSAPISGEDIKNIFEMVTVILQTGTALTAFAQGMKKLFAKHPDARVKVSDPRTGKEKGQITAATS